MPGLSITTLKLSHFRSHKVARMGLDGRPIALFGPNGAGKTNILEAVSMLSPGRGLRRARSEDMSRQPEALGWKITAELQSLHMQHEIATSLESGGSRLVQVDGKTTTQVALGRISRVLWLVPTMDRLWIEGADGRRRFLDRMTMSFEPNHAEATLSYEKAMRERNRLLKDQVQDPHWFGALETQMAKSGADIIQNREDALSRVRAAQAQRDVSNFPSAVLEIHGPDGTDASMTEAQLLAGFADGRGQDFRAGRTLTGPHRADLSVVYAAKNVPAKQCSTGEQKALLISLILANAAALAEDFGAPPLLLLDEVAAHLDATRRAALYDEIHTLGAQAWMTGTGAELFETLGDRAQYFEILENDGQSTVLER